MVQGPKESEVKEGILQGARKTLNMHHPPPTDLVLHTAREQFLVSPQEETRLWIKSAEALFERLCNTRVTVLALSRLGR